MTTTSQVLHEINTSHAPAVEKLVADRFFEHVWGTNPNQFHVDVEYNDSGLHLNVTGALLYNDTTFTLTSTFPEPPAAPIHSTNILAAQELLLEPNYIGAGAAGTSELAWGKGVGYGALTESLFGGEYTVRYGHHVTASTLVGPLDV